MNTDKFGRREFIKYGLTSSVFLLSGCSTAQKKLAFRGLTNSFPSEFVLTYMRHPKCGFDQNWKKKP